MNPTQNVAQIICTRVRVRFAIWRQSTNLSKMWNTKKKQHKNCRFLALDIVLRRDHVIRIWKRINGKYHVPWFQLSSLFCYELYLLFSHSLMTQWLFRYVFYYWNYLDATEIALHAQIHIRFYFNVLYLVSRLSRCLVSYTRRTEYDTLKLNVHSPLWVRHNREWTQVKNIKRNTMSHIHSLASTVEVNCRLNVYCTHPRTYIRFDGDVVTAFHRTYTRARRVNSKAEKPIAFTPNG